ncbi:GerAB/ArcD/ProY family transporter [Clostridium sp. 19966]|uniref:GerAB/ArcD/ProY family transporter n=1 Tax=Clostridium sp. 19966 TaxID=2768166 RepID=UPI0028DF06E0|nr:GerAB/ArcD/ProY family transporter [Clostridium sp. 19966]MDT8717994.1 GerAB/ArcD/ProY family transporter [Clostridium sp. 19966]
MSEKLNQITSKQLISFIISSQIGLGIITLPSILAKEIGHDGWISVLLSGLAAIMIIFPIMKLLNRFPGKSILDINTILYGKIIGSILNLIFIIYLLASAGISSRSFGELINIIILQDTPQLVSYLLIMSPTLYFAAKGLKVICRFDNLLYFAHILIILPLLLVIKHVRFTYLQPVLQPGFLEVIKAVPCTIYSFLGFELITIFYPNVTNKEHTKRHVISGIAYVMMYFIIITAFSVLLFGEDKLKLIVFPIFYIEEATRVPIIERLDLFFIMVWVPTMAASVRAYFFSSYYCLTKVFHVERTKMLIAIVMIITVIIGRIPRNFESLFDYMGYNSVFGMINIGIILLSFLISCTKKRV